MKRYLISLCLGLVTLLLVATVFAKTVILGGLLVGPAIVAIAYGLIGIGLSKPKIGWWLARIFETILGRP